MVIAAISDPGREERMTQALMASIERTCPTCGAPNRILTTEIRPYWKINCSRCGGAIAERRAFRPVLVHRAPETREPRKEG
jgi:endogenous inhibitor of DNA gyrase (YacG/DUF329 family)